MPSTYSTSLGLELIGDGEQVGTWGTTTNRNLGTLLEQAIAGVVRVTLADADVTLTSTSGASNQARNAVLLVDGTSTASRDVIIPAVSKVYIVSNVVSGGQSIRIKTATGTGVTVATQATALVFCDGTDMYLVSDNQVTAGGVTSVTAGLGLVGGTITTSGTIDLETIANLTPGTYGGSTQVPVFTVDAHGRITYASAVSIGGGSGTGTVTEINTGAGLTGGPITTTGTIALATTGVIAGTYGTNSQTPRLVIDAYGRITQASGVVPIDPKSISNTGGTVSTTTTGVTISSDGAITITNNSGNLTVSGPAFFNGSGFSVAAATMTIPSTFRMGTSTTVLKVGSDTTENRVLVSSSGTTIRGVMWDSPNLLFGRGVLGGSSNVLMMSGDTTGGSATFTVGTVFKTGGGTFSATSDARLKDIQGSYDKGLEELKALSPIRFKYKQDNDKIYTGLIAQEVATTPFSSMVFAKEDGYLAIDNSELVYALINAVKELDNKLRGLYERISAESK